MKVKQVISVLFAVMAGVDAWAAASGPELVYSVPSEKWMGALPLGNGRLGAMVYGGTDVETVALNEVTLWSGQPDPGANDLCGPEKLREMREAFLSGDYKRGNELGWQNLCGHGKSFGTHLPFGDLLISMPAGAAERYTRRLALDEAVARVGYVSGGVSFRREYFASNPAQALVIRYTADKPGAVSATVSMRMLRHSEVTARGNRIDISGDARFGQNGEGGVRFRGIVSVTADGGAVRADGDRLIVENADAMTLVVDIRTDFHNLNYRRQCLATVEAAEASGYERLKEAHVADFKGIFDRMSIDLGPNTTEAQTTGEMFAEARSGRPNPAFDALFFQYGRYMQISSSREDSPLPSNLQGIWNDNLACNMPWRCDYHLDINIQQNYWSANIANMAECNTPLFTYISLLAKYGSATARKMYGCRGWVAHTINNVWGDTAPGGACSWAMNVTAGAWMATHLWTHYEYTLDDDYLREVGYPLLKETAMFFIDYMVEDPETGYLLTGPSISPENAFRGDDGRGYSLSMMPTIDRATVCDIYNACIKASRILGIDDGFRARLEADVKRLPPLRLLENGELAEWQLNVVREDQSHRHASHLLALYPYGQISPEKTPELAKGCRLFLDNQVAHPNWEDTEWTRGNNINFYARLLDGERAYGSLIGLYTGFMRENLMTVSPAGIAGAASDIFSFDATEAAVAGVCEMLLQSYDGRLDFLPALPDAWKTGSIRGVCARGAIEADFAWKDSKVVSATLRSRVGQTVRVKINGKEKSVELKAGVPLRLL